MSEHKGNIVYNDDGTPNWIATQQRDAGGTGGGNRGAPTGSITIEGSEFWTYADGSTSPKTSAQTEAGGSFVGDTVVGPNGTLWPIGDRPGALPGAAPGLSDTAGGTNIGNMSGLGQFLTVTDPDTGKTFDLPPGQYQLGSGDAISVGPNGLASSIDPKLLAGDSGGPSRVGVQAPDPYGAALLRFKHYDALIERGDITAEDAADAWQRDFDEITANSRIAAERVAAEQRLQDTATRRGELQFDILRSSLPEGTNLNLGPAGVVPSNVVNMQDILTQGLPSLPEQYASIGDQLQPIAGLPEVAPRELPPASLLDPMLGLADKTAAGSMGFLA